MSLRVVIYGMVLVGVGCYMFLRRKEEADQPRQVRGLAPLQDVLGDRLGSLVHFAVFVAGPFALGGYALVTGLGIDRSWGPRSFSESPAQQPMSAEDARFQFELTEARLIGNGFTVVRLEGAEGLRVSDGSFTGSIVKAPAGWRVECRGEEQAPESSLLGAEQQLRACHDPR